LLHCRDWTSDNINAWRYVVDDIQRYWCAEASIAAFPKLRMLRHTVNPPPSGIDFSAASEAQSESFHAQFNQLFHDHHHKRGIHTAERLRHSLVDAALRAVQPCLAP